MKIEITLKNGAMLTINAKNLTIEEASKLFNSIDIVSINYIHH